MGGSGTCCLSSLISVCFPFTWISRIRIIILFFGIVKKLPANTVNQVWVSMPITLGVGFHAVLCERDPNISAAWLPDTPGVSAKRWFGETRCWSSISWSRFRQQDLRIGKWQFGGTFELPFVAFYGSIERTPKFRIEPVMGSIRPRLLKI